MSPPLVSSHAPHETDPSVTRPRGDLDLVHEPPHQLEPPAPLVIATELGLEMRRRDERRIEPRAVVHDEDLDGHGHSLRVGNHLDLDLADTVLQCVEAPLDHG